jgi:hypothetical protein
MHADGGRRGRAARGAAGGRRRRCVSPPCAGRTRAGEGASACRRMARARGGRRALGVDARLLSPRRNHLHGARVFRDGANAAVFTFLGSGTIVAFIQYDAARRTGWPTRNIDPHRSGLLGLRRSGTILDHSFTSVTEWQNLPVHHSGGLMWPEDFRYHPGPLGHMRRRVADGGRPPH